MPNVIGSDIEEPITGEKLTPSGASKPTKLPRESNLWRILRLAIALPLLTISIAALFPFSILPVSTQAVVNARLSRVRAPMEGEVGKITLETGDVVRANDVLATISVPHSTVRTEQIGEGRSRQDLEDQSARLGAELSASTTEKARYDQMYSQYLQHIASDLEMQIGEGQKDAASSARRAATAGDEVKRDQQALKEHLIPKSMLDQATAKADQLQADADAKASAVRRLQKQLSDARSGFVLDPSETPPYMAARDHAAAEIDRMRSEKSAIDARLGKSLTPGSNGIQDVLSATAVGSPVSGTIWSRSVATGQSVQDGADLFRIADANSIHVEVWLDRRYGPQLSIGDTAFIYLSGLGQELEGRVTSFEGANRRNLNEEVNAIDLQAVHPDQYHVNIELSPQDRQAIYIGQSAKVLFPGSKHRMRARLYFWLTRL